MQTGEGNGPNTAAEPTEVPLQLSNIKALVEKVYVDGLGRTKDDLVIKTVRELFEAGDFQQVVLKSQEVRSKLEKLGCFKNVGVFIDTSRGEDASSNGLEITFSVKELKRVLGGITTLVGNNEGSLVIKSNLPNTFGRGENLQVEYTYGTKQSKGFNGMFIKPLHNKANTILTSSFYQKNSEWVTSGYHLCEQGISLDASFDSVPLVRHNLQWEGIWRELSCQSRTTAFPVREQAGHSLKSALRHMIHFDNRDSTIFSSRGTLFQMVQELAGIGGDVGFIKHELNYQLNVPVTNDVVIQGSFQGGFMKRLNDEKLIYICDRFFLGGPHTIRGFEQRGIGPQSDNQALGAQGYWAAGLHLYTPLPFKPGQGGIGDILRTHFFVNAGNIDNFDFSDNLKESARILTDRYRLSYGMGLMLRLGTTARIELNYCVPIRSQRGDRTHHGVQVAVGVQFL
ncbi:sorting and assembly machinery component 50 homolog [Daphnia pulicaria]|uniref:sorting and assembly machinery component 50 homolog n=1 Tax=Daphnia pulicaria TaxID=35523 RepID=UPI001EEA5E64|nr:sorting and assembly machinery component 50 homolog [Daphnia pulicaria]